MNRNELPAYVPSFMKRIFDTDSDRIINFAYADELTIEDDDIQMEFDTSSAAAKRWFYPRYSGGDMHEPVVSKKLVDLLDPNSVFFDIGAHMGYYTVLASQCCIETHSFEIDPQLVGIIDSHFERTDLNENEVNIVCSAVAENTGDYTSYEPHQFKNQSTNAVSPTEAMEKARMRVPTVSIDDYCTITGASPDVLKIDVEGFEMNVLTGMADVASTIDAIFLEIHPDLLPRYGYDLSTLFATLAEYGFSNSRFINHRAETKPEAALEPINDPQSLSDNCMLLCTK